MAVYIAAKMVSHTPHKIYLGVIVVLVLLLVYVGALSVRTKNALRGFEEWFGLADGARAAAPRPAGLRAVKAGDLLREKTFAEYRDEINRLVERAADLGDFGENDELSAACRYALRGGKRLRPMIVLEICRACGRGGAAASLGTPPDPADAALFIEYLHTASLIIDDTPAFDDDAVRRGKETVHLKTSPAVAQMAALSLVAAAYQNICRQIDWIRENCPDIRNPDRLGMIICSEVSRAVGASGAAGGQLKDTTLTAEAVALDPGAVLRIAQMKTATFFEIAFLVGYLVSGAPVSGAKAVQRAGRHFGTAFQIADDVGDMKKDEARRAEGKPGWNFANYYGKDEALKLITDNLETCKLVLQRMHLFTPLWDELYEKVWEMTVADN